MSDERTSSEPPADANISDVEASRLWSEFLKGGNAQGDAAFERLCCSAGL